VLALLFGRFIPGPFVSRSSFLDLCFGRVVEREFKAFWPSFLGVLVLDPRFWILEWSAAARPTVACFGVGRELWS
jgi:hypothetical protein